MLVLLLWQGGVLIRLFLCKFPNMAKEIIEGCVKDSGPSGLEPLAHELSVMVFMYRLV